MDMKSSRQLIQEARSYKFNTAIPLKIYLKTCIGIIEKAQLYNQNNNICMAFMFYYRYVDLCTNKLSRHPHFLDKLSIDSEIQLYRQEYLQLINLEVPAVLRIIEDLQKRIDSEYSKHQLSLARNIAKPRKINNNEDSSESSNNMKKTPEACAPKPISSKNEFKNKPLPKTFNENRFNQSISFFNPNLKSTALKSNNISNNHNHNHPNELNSNNENINNKNTNNKNNDTPLLHYPELPQLSFPTF